MIPAWPLIGGSFYSRINTDGAPLDGLHAFETDVGAPLQRRKSTAVTERWSLGVLIERDEDLAAFEDWWAGEVAQGAMPFIWRHPVTQAVRWWRMPSQYRKAHFGAGRSIISFEALMLPGVPWFAPYVPEPYVRVPLWVADYENGIFGVDGKRGVAADLAGVSGDFEVWRRMASGSQSFHAASYDGDIPLSAPTGVLSMAGFAP